MMWPFFPLVALLAGPLSEPSCPGGVISHVFVDNHSVFDAPSLPEDPRVRWVYRTANRIHVRTRASFIRGEILLRPGDCLEVQLAEESARILRSFHFIANADVFGVRQPDGTQHLVVETRDEWTTKTAGDVSFRDGIRLNEFSVVEENLFGRGLTVGVFFVEDEVVREQGGLVEVPRVGRRNWDLHLSSARTRTGTSWQQGWVHPFVGEVGTMAFRQRIHRKAGEFAWSLPKGSEDSHWVVPMDVGGAEAVIARRVGAPGAFFVFGGGWSREWIRPGSVEEVQAVRIGDFDMRYPVDDARAEALRPQLQPLDVDRIHLMAGVRRVRHVGLRHLDALQGVQDVPLGAEFLVSVSPTVEVREGRHDRLLRGELFWGHRQGPWIAQARTILEGRDTESLGGAGGAMEDVLGGSYFLLYRQGQGKGVRTLVVRASAEGGWRMARPLQLTLGGPAGVRGLGLHEEPGGRRIVLSVEERIGLRSPFPEVFDLGTTLFVDTGRMWPGGRPWEVDSGWRSSAGVGLRLGFPAGSASVIRFDLALPLDGERRRPVLNIHAREWLGLDDALQRLDLDRSRWHGVRLRFPGVAQTGLGR